MFSALVPFISFWAADPVNDPLVTTLTQLGISSVLVAFLLIDRKEIKQDRDHYRDIAEKVLPAFSMAMDVIGKVEEALKINDRNVTKMNDLLQNQLDPVQARDMTRALEDATRSHDLLRASRER